MQTAMTYDRAKSTGSDSGSFYEKPDFGFWMQVRGTTINDATQIKRFLRSPLSHNHLCFSVKKVTTPHPACVTSLQNVTKGTFVN